MYTVWFCMMYCLKALKKYGKLCGQADPPRFVVSSSVAAWVVGRSGRTAPGRNRRSGGTWGHQASLGLKASWNLNFVFLGPPLGTYVYHFSSHFIYEPLIQLLSRFGWEKNEESPIASKVCHAATQPRGPSHRVKIPGFRTSFQERGIFRSGQARHSPRIRHR